jgi:hypothetical protein
MPTTCSLLLLLLLLAIASYASATPNLVALGTESLDSGAAMACSAQSPTPSSCSHHFHKYVCSVFCRRDERRSGQGPPPPPRVTQRITRLPPVFRSLIWTQALALVFPHALVCCPAATLLQCARYAVRHPSETFVVFSLVCMPLSIAVLQEVKTASLSSPS